MADYDTYMFYAGVYPDVESAEMDYQTVKDIYYSTNIIDTFDAAVVGKREDGKVKIYKKHEQPTRHGGWTGAGWGLATGVVIALFPAAAIGTGLLAGTTAIGAGVGALAGHASGGMSRSDLKEMGEELDVGEAALIVAAASDMESKVAAALTRADKVVKKPMKVDQDALNDELDEAQKDAG